MGTRYFCWDWGLGWALDTSAGTGDWGGHWDTSAGTGDWGGHWILLLGLGTGVGTGYFCWDWGLGWALDTSAGTGDWGGHWILLLGLGVGTGYFWGLGTGVGTGYFCWDFWTKLCPYGACVCLSLYILTHTQHNGAASIVLFKVHFAVRQVKRVLHLYILTFPLYG